MRRRTGQRALYEAWSRSRGKPKRPSLLERLRPQLDKLRQPAEEKSNRAKTLQPAAEAPVPPTLKPPKAVERREPSHAAAAQPWLKARAVQFNAGRIEFSVSYQIAVAVGLVLILFMLVTFKLGQMDQRASYRQANRVAPSAPTESGAAASNSPVSPRGSTPPARTAPAATQGDHWIVLAHYQRQADLEAAKLHFAERGVDTMIYAVAAVRQHFADHGLDTSLLPSGEGFMLVTDVKQLYDNPERAGTNGFKMKQRIKEIGAEYKPPPGLESFAPNRFSDAYGMKIQIAGED